MQLSGKEKAATFLALLGKETATRLLHYLPPEYAEMITAQLSKISKPNPETVEDILEEFDNFISLPSAEDRQPLTQPERRAFKPLDRLTQTDPKELSELLIGERLLAIAFILKLLPLSLSSDILLLLAPERQKLEELQQRLKEVPATERLKERLIEVLAQKAFGK